MNFDTNRFWQFCAKLVIPTKEQGDMRFDQPLGTQRYLIRKIAEALNEDVHTFVVLKGRQLGISTIMLALDLYWMFAHPGITGTIVCQDELTREDFRTKLGLYHKSLPRAWRRKATSNNRVMMMFSNRSGIVYQIAGTRSGTKLGRGKGITFMHATELGSWGNNESGLASLQASLAEVHPHRLFLYESTANGYDMFYNVWETATRAATQRAIFVPWWMNEYYAAAEGTPIYRTYWGRKAESRENALRRLEPAERRWIGDIRRQYKYELTPEQIAWWRYKINEQFAGDIDLMHQEFPPTEDYAFRLTGSQFFPSGALNDQLHAAKKHEPIPYLVTFGAYFQDTQVMPATHRNCNLRVWEPAQPDAVKRGFYYALGGDPAYGSSEWKDGSVATVYRVYADGVDQAAEFYSTGCNTTQLAWIIAVLAGWYQNTRVNIELTGPGQVVYQELEQLARIAAILKSGDDSLALSNVVRHMRHYIYNRFNGSPLTGNVRHWQTTAASKDRLLSSFRDSVSRGVCNIRSVECIEEMRKVVRDGTFIGGAGRDKDDRTLASALAHIAWKDNMQVALTAMRVTRAASEAAAAKGNQPIKFSPETYVLQTFMKQRGLAR